jgi:DtxR family Mn-dependent transcriptional regulator
VPKNYLNFVEFRYMTELYRLWESEKRLSTGVLASKFGVRPASVVDVLERLERRGLIERPRWGKIIFTRKGLTTAAKIIHNHRVLELYFRDMLGISDDEACHQAKRIDHLVGDLVVWRMCERLSYPERCIHGYEVRHKGCRRN